MTIETSLIVWDQLEKSRHMLEKCEGRVKSAGLNALNHIGKARQIAELDPQMACFRAICAEEEAATSLLASLKDQKYPLSEQTNWQSHDNEAGVIVLIKAVTIWFESSFDFDQLPFMKPRLIITDEPGRPAIELIFPFKGIDKCLRPRPPLNLRAQGDIAMKDMIGDFLRKNVKRELAAEVKAFIKKRANERNLLLYASDTALPGCFPDVNRYLVNQAAIVNALITAVGLIDPWRKPEYPFSGIVEAALEEYVHIMKSGRKNRLQVGRETSDGAVHQA
ncbi:hypothetical protein [Pseudomonas syringae]|uniref:hypothetical protein n=1 Tax=Pseudomonas syringae TaxID=317 RepID=UPI0011DD3BBD|nr:hypothetical protein [Pseudomonas syringae]